MEKVVHISLKQGNHQMDMNAPTPSDVSVPKTEPTSERHTSAVGVTIAGAGGCGINLARGFYGSNVVEKVALFDTSMTNTRPGESAFIVTNGSGSGSNRAENANDIERVIPQISKEDIGETDVAIVTFSLSGGKLVA